MRVVLFIVLMLVLVIGLAAAFRLTLVSSARFDIVPRLVGARAMLTGQSPYTDAVTADIQRAMFGGVLPPDADQQRFAYPAYAGVLLLPLALLSLDTAISLWLSIQFVSLLAVVAAWTLILDWQPRPITLVLLMLAVTIGFRYPLNGLLVGNFTASMLLLLSLGVLF
ncbi:MAG: hypothetical protein HC828_17385 [Blastochloris sp.]|nr:hypothetical protein [Blastochloris sp.]